MLKLSISPGNKKMGYIPSVSLPPVITCANGCACARKCYAAKLCRIYPTVKAAYQRNYELLNGDEREYWRQVRDVVSVSKYFRFHVSGDIVNIDYFAEMVTTARLYPGCDILAFTKKYYIVNRYIDLFGPLPKNLKIIFSEWPGMEMNNKYDLPVAHVIFKGETPADDWKICGGNCSECACRGVGCWTLNGGDHIAFYEH